MHSLPILCRLCVWQLFESNNSGEHCTHWCSDAIEHSRVFVLFGRAERAMFDGDPLYVCPRVSAFTTARVLSNDSSTRIKQKLQLSIEMKKRNCSLSRNRLRFNYEIKISLKSRIATMYSLVSVYDRSEEHTSELQSRPHISYAVFCLKKQIPF